MFRPFTAFDPEAGEVVIAPERDGPGTWTGCPGVLYEPGRGRFLLTYRQRRPRRDPATERGWRCAVAVSGDGRRFEDIWAVTKAELGTPSMERFCLLPAPGGEYQLFLSYVDPADNRWRIDALRSRSPDGFVASARVPVLTAGSTGTEGVKDPYAIRIGPVVYLLASFASAGQLSPGDRERAHATADIYNTGLTTHPTGLATSLDGRRFTWHGEVLGVGTGWDRYQARINSVVRAGPWWIGFYDGSASERENYEERTGLAISADLRGWSRLTPDGPWMASRHASGALRYMDAVPVGDELWLYYEHARPDGAHELRLSRISW